MKNITVIGSGTMGNGIAHTFAQCGYKVALVDVSEEALKKAGFTDVTVDPSTTPATLNGTVPKGKTTDMMKVAMDAGSGKTLKNATTEK